MHAGFVTFILVWGLGVIFLTTIAIADRKSKDKDNHNDEGRIK